MASNPFDAFDAPAKRANPFDAFDAPAAQGSPTPSTGATSAPISPSSPGAVGQSQGSAPPDATGGAYTYAPVDPNSSYTAQILAHLHNVAVGSNNWQRAFGDTFTLGGLDKAQSMLPGSPSLADLRAQTGASRADLGPVGSLTADVAGYGMGPGKILGAAMPAGILGAGAEGAIAGGLGAAGHGGDVSDIAQGAGMGAAGGAVGGVLGKVLGGLNPKPKVPDVGVPQSSTGPATGMYGQKVAAYAPLDQNYFDGPTVRSGVDQGHAVIGNVRDPQGQGTDLGIPPEVEGIVKNLYNQPVATGRVIQQASQDLRGTGDWTGHRYADALDNILNTAQPISINGVPTGQVGEAGAAKVAGDTIYGRINDLERLGADPSQLTPGAVSKTASFYQPSPNAQPGPEAQSLTALQNAMRPPFNPWHIRHMAAPLVGAALGGAEGFFNPAEKQNPFLTAATQGLEGAALFSGIPAGAAAMGRARTANALTAARYALATGQSAPSMPKVGDALRNLILGPAASNQWPY